MNDPRNSADVIDGEGGEASPPPSYAEPGVPVPSPGRSRRSAAWHWLSRHPVESAGFMLLSAYYLVFVPNVLNTPYYTGSDAGVFNASFTQLSRGARLYADVFDHKDPLYFYGYSVFRGAFGTGGPMLWETIVSLATIAVVLALGRALRLPPLVATVCAAAYVLFYFGAPYLPLHTYHQALAFLLAGLLFAFRGRPVASGALFAMAMLSKLTVGALLPCVLAANVLGGCDRRRAGRRLALTVAGGSAVGLVVALVLLVRGELAGYADVIRVNLAYSRTFGDVLGLENRPYDQLRTIVGGREVALGLTAIAVLAGAVIVRVVLDRRAARPVADGVRLPLTALLAALGVAVILNEGAWFTHYFESVAPVAFLLPATLAAILLRFVRRRAVSHGLALAVCALFVIIPFANHARRDALPASCDFLNDRGVIDTTLPPCLEQLGVPQTSTFGVVARNHSNSPPGSVADSMELACRLFFQFPWFEGLFDELLECIADKPDVVFLGSLDWNFPVGGPVTTFPFIAQVNATLARHFVHVGGCGGYQVWTRRERPARAA